MWEGLINSILARTRVYFASQNEDDRKYIENKKNKMINDFNQLHSEYSKLKGKDQGLKLIDRGTLPNSEQRYKGTFKEQLQQLANFNEGQKLLKNVIELFSKETPTPLSSQTINNTSGRNHYSQLEIILTNTGDSQYHPNSNRVLLNFNKALATNKGLYSVYPLIHGKAKLSDTEELIEAKDGLSPFFISAFHEFDHYKDYKDADQR
jgi:hypothetical protein